VRKLKVLTVRQPAASAILAGLKEEEFRTWLTRHRAPLLIHVENPANPLDFCHFVGKS
jgi:hypothetical protein